MAVSYEMGRGDAAADDRGGLEEDAAKLTRRDTCGVARDDSGPAVEAGDESAYNSARSYGRTARGDGEGVCLLDTWEVVVGCNDNECSESCARGCPNGERVLWALGVALAAVMVGVFGVGVAVAVEGAGAGAGCTMGSYGRERRAVGGW